MCVAETEQRVMEDEDYVLSPCGTLGGRTGLSIHNNKFLSDFATTDEALEFMRERMDQESFWPNIWWISDHGNFWQIDKHGAEIKEDTDN